MSQKKDKQFKCPQCDWSGKTKGSLTQHVNKEHEDDPLAKVRAGLGDMAPRPGGAWKPDKPLRAMPSGIPSVDYAIGIGGVPQGTLVEVFGPPKIGKTFTALTFSAHAQRNGGAAGYLDVENAATPTFMQLVPGLDIDALEFGQPENGEQALEVSKQFIRTGQFAVWTIDSLHACIPEAVIDLPIGSKQSRAALARLLSEGLPVLEHVTARTPTVLILVNHQKTKPDVTHGRDWYTPGGSAPEFYTSVRLRVWGGETYYDKKSNVRIGHKVKVKVEASKVAAPYTTAEYDLFYQAGQLKETNREVEPGVDIPSSWISVLEHEGRIVKATSGEWLDTQTGEKLGYINDVRERLADNSSELAKIAHDIVYPKKYR